MHMNFLKNTTPHTVRKKARLSQRSQRGNVAPFLIISLVGAILASAYALDTGFMVDNSAQLKRATDAAAMAVGTQRLNNSETSQQELEALAYNYIKSNVGMSSDLDDQISAENITLTISKNEDTSLYRVEASFTATSPLLDADEKNITVYSTVEVIKQPTEIAIIIPNTLTEKNNSLAAIRRLLKDFTGQLLENSNQRWISLVPYSQSVNVYDENDSKRIKRWASAAALTPVELTSLFRSGKARNLADARIPDRIAKLLCVYRGLGAGKNFYWDEAPTGQFKIYYRHDLPANGSPGASPISWVGPNPDLGQANGVEDTRWMVADRGCPSAALLPLTDDQDLIDERLEEISTRFNVNYAIAMSWAGASLSPEMRGTAGWGDLNHPYDFNDNDDADNKKIIIMLANTSGDWFDTDGYNSEVGEPVGSDSTGTDAAKDFARQRFIDLCNSFQDRNIEFHFIGVREGDPEDHSRKEFGQYAVPGLNICTTGNGSLTFVDADTIYQAEKNIATTLNDIVSDIDSFSSIRLVE